MALRRRFPRIRCAAPRRRLAPYPLRRSSFDQTLLARTLPANHRIRRIQGAYYLATGVWPLIHRRSFEAISGKKRDFWLAETVGAITAAVGLTLALAGKREDASPEITLLGFGTAAGFAAVDFAYGLKRRISAVYLIDGVLQLAIIAAHAQEVAARRTRR
jgi:hypothetical protein